MRKVLILGVAVVAVSLATPVVPSQHKSTKRRTPASSHAPVKSAKAPLKGSKTASTKTGAKGKRKTVARRPMRSTQQAPTPERYQEIQHALVGKGYFTGEPNGRWGPDSVEALKRFQADQSLMPDGKLNSLSLIALGLGPNRTTAQSTVPGVIPQADAPK